MIMTVIALPTRSFLWLVVPQGGRHRYGSVGGQLRNVRFPRLCVFVPFLPVSYAFATGSYCIIGKTAIVG